MIFPVGFWIVFSLVWVCKIKASVYIKLFVDIYYIRKVLKVYKVGIFKNTLSEIWV